MDSFVVTCASCGTANRIPDEKEGQTGKCGSCHSALPALYWHPQQLNESNFDNFVSHFDGPVLAEFWASW